MSVKSNSSSLLERTTGDYRSSWKTLVLTDIVYKLVAFIVLFPLVGVSFRVLMATSGGAVKSDLDILFYFLGPAGWTCLMIVGALRLSIIALEQASLMAIICANSGGKNLGPIAALRFAAAKFWPIIRVTIRIAALTLVAVAPFLAVAAGVYFALLTEFDINYYLKERPPEFGWAIGCGVVIGAALIVLLLRLFSGWFFALPLVLFEEVSPRNALRQSVARAAGHRIRLIRWILGWALMMAALSVFFTGLVGLVARLLNPDTTDSLRLLAVTVGVILLLGFVVNLAVNLLSTTTFASILFNLYRELGRDGVTGAQQFGMAEAANGDSYPLITRGRLVIAGSVGMVIAVIFGTIAIQGVRLDDDVEIMAHRGSSTAAPENTMAAFRQAIEDGADWIELDVQETADGEVVVFHDSDFMRLAGENLKIWDARLNDLKDIDVGSWLDPEFKDQRVPTLAAVLNECKGKIKINIELKYYGHDEQLEQRVADIVETYEMSSDVVAMSLKMDRVKQMKAIRPDWEVGLLMSVSAGKLKNLDADFLAVNAGFANPRLIRNAHGNGKRVFVWTVNDALTMSTMISRGVDGLLTDKPALARSVLQQRSEMSVPERLLLEMAGILGSAPELGEQ